MIRVRMTST